MACAFDISPFHLELIATLCERLGAAITVLIDHLGHGYKITDMSSMMQPIYDNMAAAIEASPFYVTGDSVGGTSSIKLIRHSVLHNQPVVQSLILNS